MSEYVYVLPAAEQRGAFARWALAQDAVPGRAYPGWSLSVEQYATVPHELLSRALVDGYTYDVPSPQPKPAEPVGGDVAGPGTVEVTEAPKPRKRAARKRAAPRKKPSPAEGTEGTEAPETSADGEAGQSAQGDA